MHPFAFDALLWTKYISACEITEVEEILRSQVKAAIQLCKVFKVYSQAMSKHYQQKKVKLLCRKMPPVSARWL